MIEQNLLVLELDINDSLSMIINYLGKELKNWNVYAWKVIKRNIK
jgi:hypothetical protein